MAVFNSIMLWLHLAALSIGGAATFGMPILARQAAAAAPEGRPALQGAMKALSRTAHAGLGLLLVTGPILFGLKWSFTAPSMTWFTVKMLLVAALLAVVIYAGINRRKLQRGEGGNAALQPRLGLAMMVLLMLTILAAVFAFE